MGVQTVDGGAQPLPRRRFVRLLVGYLIGSTLALVLPPIIGFLAPPRRSTSGGVGSRLLVGTTADIPPGRSKVVALGAKPVIVLNSPQGVKAFSAVCTHLGCIVGYDTSMSPDIVSPCHDGHFDAVSARVLSGPPPLPLKEYPVRVEADKVYLQDA